MLKTKKNKGRFFPKRELIKHKYVCENCEAEFESVKKRRFCSIKCKTIKCNSTNVSCRKYSDDVINQILESDLSNTNLSKIIGVSPSHICNIRKKRYRK